MWHIWLTWIFPHRWAERKKYPSLSAQRESESQSSIYRAILGALGCGFCKVVAFLVPSYLLQLVMIRTMKVRRTLRYFKGFKVQSVSLAHKRFTCSPHIEITWLVMRSAAHAVKPWLCQLDDINNRMQLINIIELHYDPGTKIKIPLLQRFWSFICTSFASGTVSSKEDSATLVQT